jgi:hypothetical protein
MNTDQVPSEQPRLADFPTDLRVIPLSIICIGIGVAGAYLALILLKLIYLFTSLFFFHHWSFDYKSRRSTLLDGLKSSSRSWEDLSSA